MKNDYWYVDVDIDTGLPSRNWVDSFQAFFPSLMVRTCGLNVTYQNTGADRRPSQCYPYVWGLPQHVASLWVAAWSLSSHIAALAHAKLSITTRITGKHMV